MSLTPKDLAKKVAEKRANEKAIKAELRKDKRVSDQIKDLEDSTFYQEVALPVLESALDGNAECIFIDKYIDSFLKNKITDGGFRYQNFGNLSAQAIRKEFPKVNLDLIKNIEEEKEKLNKLNNIISEISYLITEAETDEEYFNHDENNFFIALIDFSAKNDIPSDLAEKVQYLNDLRSIIQIHADIEISLAGDALKKILKKSNFIDTLINSLSDSIDEFEVISVSWDKPSKISSKLRYSFFTSIVCSWISNGGNELLMEIFSIIENSIYKNLNSVEIKLSEYGEGFDTRHEPEGIYFNEMFVGISLDELCELIEAFGYSVILRTQDEDDGTNLICCHFIKIEWVL
jgi:hypothetical protein